MENGTTFHFPFLMKPIKGNKTGTYPRSSSFEEIYQNIGVLLETNDIFRGVTISIFEIRIENGPKKVFFENYKKNRKKLKRYPP